MMYERETVSNSNILTLRSAFRYNVAFLYLILTSVDVSIINAESEQSSVSQANVSVSVVTESYNRTRATTVVEEPHIGRFDIKVGKIVQVEKHPDADTLYIEKVDIGEEQPRTIISAMVNYLPIEEMQNITALFLVNLRPIKMRGVLSEGMIMCAVNETGWPEILVPPTSAKPGDFVQVEGYERKPDAQINVKRKVYVSVQQDLKTNDKREASYKGKPWNVAGKGPALARTLSNAIIR